MTWRDLKHSSRRLKAIPGFAAIAILSLALGIGVNAAIFSVIYAAILQPLPYKDADRIVLLWTQNSKGTGNDHGAVSGGDFRDWKTSAHSFEQMALLTGTMQFTMIGAGNAERVNTQAVTPEIFPLLGVQARVGRVFRAEELPGGGCALLSYGFWQRRFGGDPAVLGKLLRISGEPRVVVGVMPPGFHLMDNSTETDIWHSIDLTNPAWLQRPVRWIRAMGKLKRGVTLQQAQEEMRSIAAGLEAKYPDTNRNVGALVETYRKSMSQFLGPVLYPLFGAVVFVLLIASTNVASLLLVRAATRRREIAIRAALGAGRRRLMSELVADGVTLGSVGALFGIAIAWAALKLFVALSPFRLPGIDDVSLNGSVLSFLALTGLLTGILVGLAPAWQASAVDDYEALKEGSRSSAGTSRVSLRGVLVSAEIALALMLLISAGLMIRTVHKMQGVDLGFDASHVTILRFDLSGERYSRPAPVHGSDYRLADPRVDQFIRQVIAGVKQIPGIESAAMVGGVPMGPSDNYNCPFEILGRPNQSNTPAFTALANPATPDFFKTLHIQLIKGRLLNEHDRENTPWAVVINETMARKFWPDRDPLGQIIRITTMPEEQPREIVGVVKDVRQFNVSYPVLARDVYLVFPESARMFRTRTGGALPPEASRSLSVGRKQYRDRSAEDRGRNRRGPAGIRHRRDGRCVAATGRIPAVLWANARHIRWYRFAIGGHRSLWFDELHRGGSLA